MNPVLRGPSRRLPNGLRHGPTSGSLVQTEVPTVDNIARFGSKKFYREVANLNDAFLLAERLRQQISGGALEARGRRPSA